jgi:hypothetical protein
MGPPASTARSSEASAGIVFARVNKGGDESEQEPAPDVLAHLFALLTVLHRA